MATQKHLHPDANDVSGANTNTKTTSTKTKKGYSPEAYSDTEAVAKKVSEKWANNPAITLLWTTQPAFAALVATFTTAVSSQSSEGGNIPVQVQTLRQLDAQMNTAVNDVKGGILNKFKKGNEIAQYARYGIEKESKNYRLPTDRDKRLINLDLMIAAIHADGFDAETWGAAFWTDMKARYARAIEASGNTDGSVSRGFGDLTNMMKQIEKTSVALRFVLRGNYPDTYKAIYRDWGWQKENY